MIGANKVIKYRKINSDFIIVESLETEYYKRYQVKFNRYILGIFKTKNQAFKFIQTWIKRYLRCPVTAS
jgi:hypothetical protein